MSERVKDSPGPATLDFFRLHKSGNHPLFLFCFNLVFCSICLLVFFMTGSPLMGLSALDPRRPAPGLFLVCWASSKSSHFQRKRVTDQAIPGLCDIFIFFSVFGFDFEAKYLGVSELSM